MKMKIRNIIVVMSVVALITGCGSKSTEVPQQSKEDQSVTNNDIQESETKADTEAVPEEIKETLPETEAVQEEMAPEEGYKEYLSMLQVHSADAIPKALSKYQSLVAKTTTQEQKDQMFRYFESFFYMVQGSIQEMILQDVEIEELIEQNYDTRYATILEESAFNEEILKTAAMALRTNGYVAFCTEGWYYLAEDPMYLYDHCSENVSDGVRQYLLQRSTDLSNGAIVSDAGLTLTWDELSDRIIAWENYSGKYPDSPEAETAKEASQNFLDVYLTAGYLDNTPMFVDGTLADDVQKSYERMMEAYPENDATKIVSDYYSILSDNSFTLTKEAENFLKENGFSVWSPSDIVEEEYEVANACIYPLQGSDVSRIAVVMTDGSFHEVTQPGVDPEWIYEGQFEIRAIDQEGKVISSLNLNQSFGDEALIFKERFDLAFEDYNSDGNLDFTIGQAGTSNGNLYSIYTIMEDSTIKELPIEEGDECIFSSQFVYSTAFTRVDAITFYARFYDNTQGRHYNAFYQWDGSAFRLSREEEIVE